ncbi:UNVERIFIED_CONTAM: Ribonuclease HI [Sesamum latifolium]|uniref:Ribonuclease HI n=1 Tax=Sesamum latifolium TaxID=2727402 RepID=A0AAW2WVE7_9LAMI
MELGVGSHPGPGIYAYYLRPYCAELLDIGTSYPIRATTVATASPSTTHLQTHRRYLCHLLHIYGSSTLVGSGAGVVLTSPEGDELEYALYFDFKASNNETEYEALIVGVRMALDVGARNLIAYMDSQLVTKQVGGEYEVKEERMKEYLQEIGELTSRLKSFQLHQIPRTENAKTDYLARLPSSLVDCNTRSITIKTFVKNYLKTDIATLQVETDWRKPLLDYLREDILHANEKEAARLKSRAARTSSTGMDYLVLLFLIMDDNFMDGKFKIGVLSKGIKTKLTQAGGQWVDALPRVLWAYRTTPRSTTGETPFNLVYGSEAVIPGEADLETFGIQHYEQENNDNLLRANLDLIDEV